MLALTSLLEPMRLANYLSSKPLFNYTYHAAEPGPAVASNGMPLDVAPLPERLGRNDIVVVAGSWGAERYTNPVLISWLRRMSRIGPRFCAVELGTYVLARAGLLDGCRATTHWSYLPGFQEKFPKVVATEQLYTIDRNTMTCAGWSACTDLMLHLIAQDHGTALVSEIASNMLHFTVRPMATSQRKAYIRDVDALPPAVQAAVDLIETHIYEPLPIPRIAEKIGISQRQLVRQFNQAMGCSIVHFALVVRLEHARALLTSTDLGVREISAASGFNSLSHFSNAFRKFFGRRPSEYRQAWPDQADAPIWPGTLSNYLETLQGQNRPDPPG